MKNTKAVKLSKQELLILLDFWTNSNSATAIKQDKIRQIKIELAKVVQKRLTNNFNKLDWAAL